MKINGLVSFLSCTILLFSASCSSSKKAVHIKPEPFTKTAIVIDGNDIDWPSPYPYYDSKALISYASCNDNENLYLSVKATDRKIIMKILKGGMKISIDTSGGKDEYMTIQSPMPGAMPEKTDDDNTRTSRLSETDPNQHSDQTGWRNKMMLGAEQFTVSGFGACDGHYATSEQAQKCGIRIKIAINEYNELVWEAAIPFAAWHHHLSSRDAAKPINVCFEIAALKMPVKNHGGQGSGGHMGGGGMGGGMHGGGGGGMHGGGGGMHGGGGGMHSGGNRGAQNSEESEALAKTSYTYLKTVLAWH